MPWKIKILFTHKRVDAVGNVRYYNETFAWTPASVFHESQMKPSYKGDGGARQYMNNFIRKKKYYPRHYVRIMQSYDTKQMIDHNVMVSGKVAPSKRFVASKKPIAVKESVVTNKQQDLIREAEQILALVKAEERLPN